MSDKRRIFRFKARCIHPEHGKWAEGVLENFLHDGAYTIWKQPFHHGIPVDPDTVCQFVELYDKRHNEVYSGDMFSVKDLFHTEKPFVVSWDALQACYYLRMSGENKWRIPLDKLFCDTHEVIGNICDDVEVGPKVM